MMKHLLITHVEGYGPYLKVFGQIHPEHIALINAEIHRELPTSYSLDMKWSLERQLMYLVPNAMCLYRDMMNPTADDVFRVRIRSILPHIVRESTQTVIQVDVEFVDYGYMKVIPCYELIFMKSPNSLENIKPLAFAYIVLGVCKDWSKDEMLEIWRILKNQTFEIRKQFEFENMDFITLKFRGFDFAEFLIHQRSLGAPISNNLLRENIAKMVQNSSASPVNAKETINAATYNQNNNNGYNVIRDKFYNNNNMKISPQPTISYIPPLIKKPSVNDRLLQYRNDMPNIPTMPSAPRMPVSSVGLRSMLYGMQMTNRRIPSPLFRPMRPTRGAGASNGFSSFAPTKHLRRPTSMPSYVPPSFPAAPLDVFPTTSTTYKTNSLIVGTIYDVYVSFVEDGPNLFFVQLSSDQSKLGAMMNELEGIDLRPLRRVPTLGSACVARYKEDNQLYRALITRIQGAGCKVNYVDYGNSGVVSFDNLYEISERFLRQKPFACRFKLSQIKGMGPIDDIVKRTFKDLVIFKNCRLKVTPLDGPPLVQLAELYLHNDNVIEMLKAVQKARLNYRPEDVLHDDDTVIIRFIDTPKLFYVQKVANVKAYETMMDEMFVYYNANQRVPQSWEVGSPCVIKYIEEWYRSEILQVDDQGVIVRLVDFGTERVVTKNLVSTIATKHLTLPRQAIECCLKGFEIPEVVKTSATTAFEMLAEAGENKRRSFRVKVFGVNETGNHLVNLIDNELNMMKMLFKFSMPFEQYLTLEKGDPALRRKGGNQKSATAVAPTSPTNKRDIASMGISDTTNENMLPLIQKPISPMPAKAQKVEWDKMSSSSSKDTRDSRSSASEQKSVAKGNQAQPQTHPQAQSPLQMQGGGTHRRNGHPLQNITNDQGSVGSLSSLASSAGGGKNKPSSGGTKPKQNGDPIGRQPQQKQSAQTANSPRRQRRDERSQNAPQGYAQSQMVSPKRTNGVQTTEEGSVSSNSGGKNKSEEYMPLDQAFRSYFGPPAGARESVVISWWISPHQFYLQISSRLEQYEKLCLDMNSFYHKKPLRQLQLKVGSHVVVRLRRDTSMHRARVINCNHMQRKYRVFLVDIGSSYTVTSEDIWQVEKRFTEFPCMAVLCSFSRIIMNYDHLYLIDRMDKYLPSGSQLVGHFDTLVSDSGRKVYHVDLLVNKVSLKRTLINDGVLSESGQGFRPDMLKEQQIRAKICDIKDMLNFKIEIEGCENRLLCSYDDVRYVKSNPDVARKFKKFYEGKSCVVNVKGLNDNKVILLRPMLPLLTEDKMTDICTYPIVNEVFNVNVVYIDTSYRVYAQMQSVAEKIADLLNDMYAFYEEGGVPLVKIRLEMVCAAKGSDSNWYRARIVSCDDQANPNSKVTVYYLDYGNKEQLARSQLKELDERFCSASCYGIEINLPARPLSGDKHKEAAIVQELEELTLNVDLTVYVIEICKNRIIADIVHQTVDTSLVEMMLSKGMIDGRDVNYIRGLLEKEPANVLIEMIDLTLDEEELAADGTASKLASPKKKQKPQQNATANKKNEKEKEEKAKAVIPPAENREPEAPAKPPTAPVAPPVAEPKPQVVIPEPKPEAEVEAEAAPEVIETKPDPYAHLNRGVLSHCDNPALFYIHPQHVLDDLHKLQQNLQIVASSLPPLTRFTKGSMCASYYSVDKQWYRARIIDTELMVLKFIDFGHTDCVSDPSEVKELSVFPDIEPQCIPCALPIKPKGTADWVDAANGIFTESFQKPLYFEYLTRGDAEKRSFINLFVDGVNVAEKLIADGYALPLEVVKSGENCYISHVNGLTDFYIQYEKDSKALELIEIYLGETEKLQPLKTFEYGKIVAALFADDGMWYRAKLLKQTKAPDSNGYEVLFIDYGNTSISPECREISEEIAKLSALSRKCELEIPSQCVAWSEEAEKKFAEIAACGETVFNVELREPSVDHAIVHLYIDEHNINEDLEPLCEQKPVEVELNVSVCPSTMDGSELECGVLYEAVISYVNSSSEFYIQLGKDAERVADMGNSLNSLAMEEIANPVKGLVCAAIYPVDELLYRARVEEVLSNNQYRVFFIDFGNEAITKELRELPKDLQLLPPMCKACRLENAEQFREYGTLANDLFAALIAEYEEYVKVEFLVSETPSPAYVRMYSADEALENLGAKLAARVDRESEDLKTCLISHGTTPSDFYIQPKTNATKMSYVASVLEPAKAKLLPSCQKPDVGMWCCVFSDEDQGYFRGRITSYKDKKYEVFLIDYGYSCWADEVLDLPTELLAIPALAWKCQLDKIPDASSDELKMHFSALLDLHFGETYRLESHEFDADNNIHTVRLTNNQKDLAEELAESIKRGLQGADQLAKEPQKPLDCSVLHINSTASFYIQLEKNTHAIKLIKDRLIDAEEVFKPLTAVEVGTICAAKSPTNSLYYRAKVIAKLDGDTYEVHYIDIGANCTTDKLLTLPDNLKALPPYAQHCALDADFTDQPKATQYFQDYVDGHSAETFQVELLNMSVDPYICRLYCQEKNVVEQMLNSMSKSW